MEALLSLSFDNTSSKDIIKIRKGLRQIEGLLAQICIPPSCSQQKRRPSSSSSRLSGDTLLPPRQLSQVCQDPAYREFFRLQEGFEWNGTYSWPCFDFDRLTCTKVASRLMACLETLLGMPNGSYPSPTWPRQRVPRSNMPQLPSQTPSSSRLWISSKECSSSTLPRALSSAERATWTSFSTF